MDEDVSHIEISSIHKKKSSAKTKELLYLHMMFNNYDCVNKGAKQSVCNICKPTIKKNMRKNS